MTETVGSLSQKDPVWRHNGDVGQEEPLLKGWSINNSTH